jgi:hypothetical protein
MFAWLGVVNGDEGWYALSARLVSEGRLPYRDFVFPQGPAYVYLLAPFVRLAPSVYSARALSVICTAASVGLLIATARRIGGKWAAYASGAALLATIPALPYWLSITKTYALTCLFLSAILFTLTSRARPAIRYPVAAALAVGLAETRTTGIVLAVLLIAALLRLAPDATTRAYVVIASAVVAFPFFVLLLAGWTGATWGLLDYHQLGATGGGGIGQFVSRTGEAVRAWPGPTALCIAALVVVLVDRDLRARVRRRPDLVAFAVGIVAFIVLHETTAHFFAEEYLSPLIAPLVVMSTIILVGAAARLRAEGTQPGRTRAVIGVLVFGIVVTALTGGHSYYLGAPGWDGNPASISPVTKCVKQHSKPTDVVFALSMEEVVVASGRRAAKNVTLGMFSYEDVSTSRARKLKIVNAETLGALLTNHPPKLAVVTVDDIFETHRAGWFSTREVENMAVYQAFNTYQKVCTVKLVRPTYINSNHTVDVFVYKRGDPGS